VASVTAVLTMYLACLEKNYWLNALPESTSPSSKPESPSNIPQIIQRYFHLDSHGHHPPSDSPIPRQTLTPQPLPSFPSSDVASVTAVLTMYLASLEKNYWLSALVRLEPLQLLFDKQILFGCFLLHALV
ncbi:hypothetical protein RYX36_012155, partial [Vicia faba]